MSPKVVPRLGRSSQSIVGAGGGYVRLLSYCNPTQVGNLCEPRMSTAKWHKQ
jgi:hypothetical protein